LLFNYLAQPHKLIDTLMWLHVNDHAIEVEASHLASP
jgi:hypothetical protein